MSRLILGNCVDIMSGFPERAVDFILTDPPYLVGFRDRSGRSIAGDRTDEWLQPACNQMYRVLKKDALLVSFYGWNRVDRFHGGLEKCRFQRGRTPGIHQKTTRQNPRMSATAMNALTCWRKAVRPCHRTRCRMSSAGSISGNRHHPTEKPLPACNR